MTRHITDHPKPQTNSKSVAAFMLISREKNARNAASKRLERPNPVGNGRLVQYLMIERGREV